MMRLKSFSRHCLWPAAVLVLTAAAVAQDNAVISASYGAHDQRRDVTSAVRSMVRDGRLSFRVSNDALGGDPAPDRRKELFLRARDSRGATQEYHFNEGEEVNLQLWSRGNYGDGDADDRRGDRDDREGDRDRAQGNYHEHGRLSADDQRRFDSYYTRSLEYKQTNNREQVESMEGRMRDVYNHYHIPADTPWWAVASPGIARSDGDRDDRNDRDNDHDRDHDHGGYGQYGGNQLRILSASYGSGDRSRDVTGMLQRMMGEGGRVDARVDNESMGGDPAPDRPKTLTVRYYYDGQQREKTVREGETLRLP
jgi:hypothetical protein